MIQKIKKLLEYIVSEAGGVDVDITEPSSIYSRKPELTDEDEEEDQDKSEELYKQHVKDGKVITTRNNMIPDREGMTDVKNNANLIKARIKSRTPSANIKRKHSMLIHRRKIDHDR